MSVSWVPFYRGIPESVVVGTRALCLQQIVCVRLPNFVLLGIPVSYPGLTIGQTYRLR